MKRLVIKRPYATRYFNSITDGERAYVAQGAAKTEEGAKVSTIVRLVLDKHMMARVYDRRNEVLIFTFKRTVDGVKMSFGREDHSNIIQLKRRLK